MSINIECREREDSIIQVYLTLEKTRNNRIYLQDIFYKIYFIRCIYKGLATKRPARKKASGKKALGKKALNQKSLQQKGLLL